VLLSQTGKYALRAAIYLAERGGDEAVPVGEIAEALDVPRNYLSKILHQLVRGGVLVSVRGPHGGFRLAPGARELSVARVLAPVDSVDPLGERRCLLGRPECSDTDPCPFHERWRDLADAIVELLEGTALGVLARPSPQGDNHD
jgi:Rrf2 family iron-sulfur cluster assembly transcriptional regulator